VSLSLAACALLVVSTSAPRAQLASSPWPAWRHDPAQTGQSQFDTSSNNGAQKWVFFYAGGGLLVFSPLSSPTLGADGTIYSTPGDDNLYAFNPNGTLKWILPTPWPMDASPAVGADGTIYAPSEGDIRDGYLNAVNSDGTLKWTFQTSFSCESSPAIASDGTIYIYCDDGKLRAINPDGTEKWELAEGFDGTNEYSSPAIGADGTIYFGAADYNLYAVNPDGTLKWVFQTPGDVESSPAIGPDGTIYVGSEFTFGYPHSIAYLFAINPDGSLKWRFQSPNYWVLSSPAIGTDGTIYFGDGLSFWALHPDGSLRWQIYTNNQPVKGSASIGADGTVYFGANDGNIYAVNPDGSIKWKFSIGSPVAIIGSSPAIGADGTIYINVYPFGPNRLYAIGHGVPPTPTPTPTPVPVKLEIRPKSLNFGTVEIGKHKGPKHVIVRNPKGGKKTPGITVTILGLSGGGGPFSVTNGCSVSDLSPGDRCSFEVTFAPTAAVSSTATLMIIDNAEQQSVDLSGKGQAPKNR
jgi:outer membrane protein assembly factor BamB